MTAKHTPGPWIFYADLPSTEPNWHIVTTANKMRVLANVHIEPGNEMDEANARLIAIAPDMLAEFKRIFTDWPELDSDEPISGGDMVDWFCQFAERARALIAKAEGE